MSPPPPDKPSLSNPELREIDDDSPKSGAPERSGDPEIFRMSGVAPDIPTARLWEMEEARKMRRDLFNRVVKWVAPGAAIFCFVMMALLVIVMFAPSQMWGDGIKPLLVEIGQSRTGSAAWPLAAFILGTFISFTTIVVVAFRVIAPRDNGKGGDDIRHSSSTPSPPSPSE